VTAFSQQVLKLPIGTRAGKREKNAAGVYPESADRSSLDSNILPVPCKENLFT
jgi:hypothetical protein